jgi:hypothetical protein
LGGLPNSASGRFLGVGLVLDPSLAYNAQKYILLNGNLSYRLPFSYLTFTTAGGK